MKRDWVVSRKTIKYMPLILIAVLKGFVGSKKWGNGDPGTKIEEWGPEKTSNNSRVGFFRSIFWVGLERFYFIIVLMLIYDFALEGEICKIDTRNAIQ